jgi:hypothetical protein
MPERGGVLFWCALRLSVMYPEGRAHFFFQRPPEGRSNEQIIHPEIIDEHES